MYMYMFTWYYVEIIELATLDTIAYGWFEVHVDNLLFSNIKLTITEQKNSLCMHTNVHYISTCLLPLESPAYLISIRERVLGMVSIWVKLGEDVPVYSNLNTFSSVE